MWGMLAKNHITRFSITALAALFITVGCKVGPKYQSPDFQAPEGYLYGTNEIDSLGDIKWWELFNDPVLDSLIIHAINYNQDLKIALENVNQARLFAGIQKAELFDGSHVNK